MASSARLPFRPRLVAAIAVLGVIGAACGGDPDGESVAPVTTTPVDTVAPTTTAEVTGGDDGSTVPPAVPAATIVATTSILGDLVARLAGDAASVTVIVPDGQDPHDFMPSARDAETLSDADLVVVNGLALEEGLVELVADAEANGVPVFTATDHVTLRELTSTDEHDHGDEHAAEEGDGHDHAGGDPHIWTAPLVMAEMIPALADAIGEVVGADLTPRADDVVAELTALDAEVREILAVIPPGECKLVTGHESFGYFAEAYGCETVGAVIPSLTTTAEASARELAELQEVAAAEGVRAVFVEVGTSPDVAEQVSEAIGVPLVELPAVDLPDEGGYAAYVRVLATIIADALGGEA